MSFVGGGLGVGTGPASGLRFAQTRGRTTGSPVTGVNYPSPFFDIAHTYLPVTVKQLFKWCRYYFLTNPLINAVVFKLSEYPVTDVVFDHKSKEVVRLWTDYFQDQLGYRAFQIECGLDFHAYGNAIISLGFPFKKYLYCQNPSCNFHEQACKIRQYWVFTNNAFRLSCPRCHQIAEALPKDVYFKNASGIKMIRWNPEDIEITYNDITGEYTYFYTIPGVVRNDVVIGKKDVVDSVPQIFLQAIKENKGIVFNKENIFHMRRPTLATQDRGWGIPLLLPVLKDVFYLQVLKKANEAVALEHVLPLRVMFPQAGSGSADPYTSISLVDWRDHVATEIARWRLDMSYIPILPLPIGTQTIGGDGKALMLTQEIVVWSEQIMNGMQVPIEFVKGGMNYSGTAVSMRMLENQFIGYVLRHKALARFIMKSVASYMAWPEANLRFKPFKMADDIQRKAYLFQLNQAGKVSDTTLLADADLSQDEENDIMNRESISRIEVTKKQQLALAEIQGEAQLAMSKYQIKAQQAMQAAAVAPPAPGEAGGPDGGAPGAPPPQDPSQFMQSPLNGQQKVQTDANGMPMQSNVDITFMAQAQANLLKTLGPAQQEMALNNLRSYSPELADLVKQILSQAGGADSGSTNGVSGVDMRSMPEQRAPRRQNGMV